MNENKRTLFLSAARSAAKLRKRHGIAENVPICPYDLAETIGVEVWFSREIGSLEGLYLAGELPTIIVPSERPAGRQRFTCAHEIGHHSFGDGDTIDEVIDQGLRGTFQPKEFRANVFASLLLMPKPCIETALVSRGLEPSTATPMDFFKLACWLGVGYEALIVHLQVHDFISVPRATTLKKSSPRAIRTELMGSPDLGDLTIVDENWLGRPVDTFVGDTIFSSFPCTFEGPHVSRPTTLAGGFAVSATAPGVYRLDCRPNGWASYVRVSRKGYFGRARYRHLPEEDEPVAGQAN